MEFESVNTLIPQLSVLAVVFGLGYAFVRAPLIRNSFLPTGLGAGLVLLFLGPQVLGSISEQLALQQVYYDFWSQMPKHLINIVFAAIFLGRPLVGFRKMWNFAGPQVAFGQMLAWGQYMIGGLVTALILVPYFKASNLSAALIEMSFEGGHGTVAGMGSVFTELGFESGADLAVGLATAGLLTGLIAGIILINWGVRRGHIQPDSYYKIKRGEVYYKRIVREIHEKGVRLRKEFSLFSLAKHSVLIFVAVLIGFGIHQALVQLELATWGRSGAGVIIFGHSPVFTFCMFGGMIVQYIWSKLGGKTSLHTFDMISNLVLGVLIATAVGTMSLQFISNDGWTFLILYLAGTIWLVGCFILLARRMFKLSWFENAIVTVGQSFGMTATGLLFAQMVDRDRKTGAVEAFSYKQLMFEPFLGGGIVTAVSMPLIAVGGIWPFTIGTGLLTLMWLMIGLRMFQKPLPK